MITEAPNDIELDCIRTSVRLPSNAVVKIKWEYLEASCRLQYRSVSIPDDSTNTAAAKRIIMDCGGIEVLEEIAIVIASKDISSFVARTLDDLATTVTEMLVYWYEAVLFSEILCTET